VGIAAIFKVSKPVLESNISKENLSPVEMAKRDIKMGNFKGAINQLSEILRKESTNEEALRMMLQAYIASRGQQDCIGLVSYLLPDLLNKQKSKVAFDLYMDFSNAFPKATLSTEAQYAAGKLLMENNFYEFAVDTLAKVTQMAPGSDLCIQAVFDIGKIQLEKLNQAQNAVAMFNWIIQNYPTHKLSVSARQMMMRIQAN
jgi:outer membrane protein assembly factor BamD (BamD/ComL family)